jgi:hypothetical protein
MRKVNESRVLLRSHTALPPGLAVQGEPISATWVLLTVPHADALRRSLENAGWHFLLLPPAIRALGLGWSRRAALAAALRKLARRADRAHLNAVQLTQVKTHAAGGIVVAVVHGYLRNIQRGALLETLGGPSAVQTDQTQAAQTPHPVTGTTGGQPWRFRHWKLFPASQPRS